MRSLRIALYAQKSVLLPLAYNELLQGLLYSCWRDKYPEIHNEGFDGVRGFRPFTFGRLQGKAKVNREDRTIVLSDILSFEVRSPVEELMDELALQLANRGQVRIGAYELPLVNLQNNDRLIFPQRAKISLATPVVVYETLADGHTRFYAPDENGWQDMILANAQRKTKALGLSCSASLQIIPLTETLHKQVTRFKGTYVNGWTGSLIVGADTQLLAALWCLGLGVKNSQGFGMFNIDERPL